MSFLLNLYINNNINLYSVCSDTKGGIPLVILMIHVYLTVNSVEHNCANVGDVTEGSL